MKQETLLFIFFNLFLILGLLYVFLTPPWQAPDEPSHFEYAELLSRKPLFDFKFEEDPELQKGILQSMAEFSAWKHVKLPQPNPLPQSFDEAPFFSGSGSKLERPPFYYLPGAIFLKIFPTESLLKKLYLLRLYSLFLAFLTVLTTYHIGKILFEDYRYALTTASFVAFLPMFNIISASINSDNLANLIGAVHLLSIMILLKSKRPFYIFPIVPVLLLTSLFTARIALVALPVTFIFLIIFILKDHPLIYSRSMIILFSFLFLLLFYFFFTYYSPELIQKVVLNAVTPFSHLPSLFESSSTEPVQMKSHFFEALFISFWYDAGWMAHIFPIKVYKGLAVLCGLATIGVIKFAILRCMRKDRTPSFQIGSFIILVSSILLMTFGTVIYQGLKEMFAMGRYLFPVLSSFASIFILGFKELWPGVLERYFLISILSLFIGLNLYALFGNIVPFFYF